LANSRNLVSIRLLRELGIDTAVEHVSHFGFRPEKLPKNLSLALGSCVVTPLELVTGYAAFSNGGFRVSPYFVARIETPEGQRVATANPALACAECEQRAALGQNEPADLEAMQAQQTEAEAPTAPRAIDKQNAWLMYSMLKDVITRGTAQSARSMKRPDIAGKTGTTNDQKDAWFSGFNGRIVTTTWLGFDQTAPLGKVETGARAALPMWIDYMTFVLKDLPPAELERPTGLVTIRIDPRTGLLANSGDPDAIFETFRESDVPKAATAAGSTYGSAEGQSNGAATDDLF
jgi:penicillin-binding protein 1A